MPTSTSASLRRLLAATAVLCVGLLSGCTGGAQPGPTAVPLRPTATASFETEDLQQLMQQMVDDGAPAVIVEVREGDEVWSHAVGVRSIRSNVAAEVGDRARIASLTKPMVATIVLQLVDEGKIALDESIETYLPGIVDGRDVRIEQLLDHTSGMPDYVEALASGDPLTVPDTLKSGKSSQELVDLALKNPWLSEPGSEHHYSNTNYVVLSMLIESVTGNSVNDELQSRITEPLELQHTSIPETAAMPEPFVHGYWIDGGLSIDVSDQEPSLWTGAGGVVSTVSDVNTFMRGLMTGKLLPPELLGYMLRLNRAGYGLGVQGRGAQCAARHDILMPVDAPAATDVQATDATATAAVGAEASRLPTDRRFRADAVPAVNGELSDNPAATVLPTVPESGSGSLVDHRGSDYIQIGQAGMVYGHLGSGLGYRALTMSSADGLRQVTVFWTASPLDYMNDSRMFTAYDLVDAGLERNC